jgi:hypothetical protein
MLSRSNKIMKNLPFLLPLTIIAALALSACGGGGGGGGSVSGPVQNPIPTTTLSPISATNSALAASNAYVASTSISGSSASVTGVLTGVSIAGVNVSTVAPALALVNRAYNRSAPKLLTGVTMSQSCSGGGTLSLTGTVRSEDIASNGDTITFAAFNCIEDGATANGGFTITLSGISGTAFNSSTWTATVDTQFNAFSVAGASGVATASGDMKIAINQTSLNNASIGISGKSFQVSASKAGVNLATHTLTDYSATAGMQGNTITASASYTISGTTSTLGKFEYSVKTAQPFVSTGGAAPSSGSMVITGASSSVTMTVVGANSVRLDYSAKGDGVITQTSTVGWAPFLSSF